MPYNIDLFDTYTMMGMLKETAPKQTFFMDRYFSTGEEDLFSTEKVLMEYEGSNQRMACFVADKAGDIPIARDEYDVHEFTPPKIAPSRLLTIDQLHKRGFGEALFTGSKPAERAVRMHMRDLTDLEDRIVRREEWMCAQMLIHNGMDIVEYVDDQTIGRTRHLKFYEGAASDHIYTVSKKWNDADGDFFGDVTAMCKNLAMRGLPVADLVMGGNVAPVIQNMPIVQKLLDNRRMEFGQLAPTVPYTGVSWLGKLNFHGFTLELWSVYETYENEQGQTTPYFPENGAMVTAPKCGRILYGAVTQLEDDKQYYTHAGKRIPKFVVDVNNDTRKLRVAARPLPVPRNPNPYVFASQVV